jgi:hypothetical protein
VDWTLPGLNTRETALAIWLAALSLWLLSKPDVRRSLWQVLKTIFGSVFIGGVIAVAAAYSAGIALALRQFGYWNTEMTKLAAVWFVAFALVAVVNTKNVDRSYYRRLLLHNLGIAVIAEFIVKLHTFPLPVEIVFTPVVFILIAVNVYTGVKQTPEYTPVRAATNWLLGLVGVVLLSFGLAYIATHFSQITTVEKAEELLLPFMLTLCFVPFLVGLRFFVVYQTTLHMIRYNLRDNVPLYAFARRSIITGCGFNLGKAQLFEAEYRGRLLGATSHQDVDRVMGEFREAWARGHRVRVEPWHEPDF